MELPTYHNGEVDIEKFEKIIDPFAKCGYPLAFVFNSGTTVTNAYDNVGVLI